MTHEMNLTVAAQLLEYPLVRTADRARAAAEWLEVSVPEAAALTRRFADAVEGMSLGAVQEAYVAAFDFATTGTLYCGEHLFGATEARASFLARIRVLQRDHGVEPGEELPDHVADVLRLAAAMPAGDERDELLRDAALPTLCAALGPLKDAGHPYASVVEAVIAVIEHVAACSRFEIARAGPVEARPADPGDSPPLFDPSPEVAR